MSSFVDKQDDSKQDYKQDVDGLDNSKDWAIRKNFDYYKSIKRVAEKFFEYDWKKAWDNIERINGLQKSNPQGYYGLKDAIDYDEVHEDIFNPIDKLKQTTTNVKYDKQEENKAVKKVLGNEDLNKMINGYFGGRTRSKKIRTQRKIKKKYKNRRSKRQTTRTER